MYSRIYGVTNDHPSTQAGQHTEYCSSICGKQAKPKNNVKYMQVEMPYYYIITQCIPYRVITRMQLATKLVTHKDYFDLLCARTVGFKGSSVDLTYAALPHPFSYSTFPMVDGE